MIGDGVQWYRMLDADPAKGGGAIELAPASAHVWNERQWGVFWTVNSFEGPRRIPNLTRVNAWAIDIDAGSKQEQATRLMLSPLVPSLIVETKRGYQAYWAAKDARPAHWNAIVLDRLVPHYGADANARDLARILRVPGYRHWKDPADPFLVRKAWAHPVAYTEVQIAQAYRDHGKREVEAVAVARTELRGTGSFWDRVYALDCRDALARLSGHAAVRGEKFTFKLNRTGTHNILCDGKGCSAWVDLNGRIGSLSHGGPTVYQWLRWYGNTPGDSAEVIKQLYPELREVSRAA